MLSFAEIERLSVENFDALARQLFELHAEHNPVYREWVSSHASYGLKSVPLYLPIEVFKHRKVFLEGYEPETEFWSSGTTSQGAVRSTHHVGSLELYRQCFTRGFELAWGKPSDYVFLALLPNYLEQSHSSLVYMMQELIRLSREEGGHKESGFYLYNLDELASMLQSLEERAQKTVLFGVSYALLDLAAKVERPSVGGTLVFETGGMKGRRREMPKEEFHEILKKAFGVDAVYSEYGMCELMSQAYSLGDGMRFRCPPWMRVSVRDRYNFFDVRTEARTTLVGPLNIIDLANIYSCPFIATQDLARLYPDGTFEIIGRTESSDIRGCNLMIENISYI